MKQIKQKNGEAQKMVKVGFPKCFSLKVGKVSEHCNTCIGIYRKLYEKQPTRCK